MVKINEVGHFSTDFVETFSVEKNNTRRSTTLAGLTNTMIYNDGIYCGQLTLQSWSYEKDFSTGRMWYVGIYKGTVRSNGGCPIG